MDYDFREDELPDGDSQAERPSLETTLEILKSIEESPFPSTLYYGLSGLTPADISQVRDVWETIDPYKRHVLLAELAEASELNFELDYRELGFFALDDPDSTVRESAVELLWEDESLELMRRLMELAQWDEAAAVRAAATNALGRFVLLGEYSEVPTAEAERVQDVVVNILTNENEEIDVRRRALEAISNSGHEIVESAIEEAYTSSEHKMRASALYAMGRDYDPDKWGEIVLREIGSDEPEMRYEAARSAGELELKEAVPGLGRIATEDERDNKEVAIWSLGEIGGREAIRILSALVEDAEENGDDVLLESIEDAIGNASLVGDELNFDDL
ncbi:MAG: HEAT repeat domain-containing protein [Chloroflexota bacterium]